MEVNLQSIEDTNLLDLERAIFDVLKATLRYPANPQAKAVKLTDDIRFFINAAEQGAGIGDTFWYVWGVVLDIVGCVPPGHVWQISLVQALDNLRHRDGPISEYDEHLTSWSWQDLPVLSASVREKWDDSTGTGEDVGEEEFAKWKNLNSFIARLTYTGFAPWLNLPIWQLREALEEPPVKSAAMNCRLWVASEWILHCADVIYEDMKTGSQLGESTARSLRTGSLCDGETPLSLKRWAFWKKRFSELRADADSLGLDRAITTYRMTQALEAMDAVEA
ncbi:Uu.00g084890.m01.CDS01 [Anthostomella pinea]|uniref:Uu.00g084890.m01.CDS01 n=1 Tax=Anthostomella pinea TaxID=933095 RepID=A0AAI8VLX3_9PEZI|nr:Uu.00g084890.m01.CDS01 [Anthostomella pinea]